MQTNELQVVVDCGIFLYNHFLRIIEKLFIVKLW